LFSAELYVRGLDGCLFAEGYVVQGEYASRLVCAATPYLPGAEKPGSTKVFNGPYPAGSWRAMNGNMTFLRIPLIAL
jgi:hypothetical protein